MGHLAVRVVYVCILFEDDPARVFSGKVMTAENGNELKLQSKVDCLSVFGKCGCSHPRRVSCISFHDIHDRPK